jgi:hypothetical protein
MPVSAVLKQNSGMLCSIKWKRVCPAALSDRKFYSLFSWRIGKMKTAVYFLMVALLVGAAQAALITDLSSSTGSAQHGGFLVEDSLNLTDRGHVYNNIPVSLAGKAEYVKLSNNTDRTANPFTVTFTLTEAADVYLLIDHRIGSVYPVGDPKAGQPRDNYGGDPTTHPTAPDLTSVMAWVITNGFVDQGISITVDEGNNGDVNAYARLYKKHFDAGIVTLYEQNNTGNRNAYGVAAIPEPASMLLLALGGLMASRKRR